MYEAAVDSGDGDAVTARDVTPNVGRMPDDLTYTVGINVPRRVACFLYEYTRSDDPQQHDQHNDVPHGSPVELFRQHHVPYPGLRAVTQFDEVAVGRLEGCVRHRFNGLCLLCGAALFAYGRQFSSVVLCDET